MFITLDSLYTTLKKKILWGISSRVLSATNVQEQQCLAHISQVCLCVRNRPAVKLSCQTRITSDTSSPPLFFLHLLTWLLCERIAFPENKRTMGNPCLLTRWKLLSFSQLYSDFLVQVRQFARCYVRGSRGNNKNLQDTNWLLIEENEIKIFQTVKDWREIYVLL